MSVKPLRLLTPPDSTHPHKVLFLCHNSFTQTSVSTHAHFENCEHHQSPRISHQSRLAGDVPFRPVSVVTVRRYASVFQLMGGL